MRFLLLYERVSCSTKLRANETTISRFHHDLHAITQDIQFPERLDEAVHVFYKQYVPEEVAVASSDLVRHIGCCVRLLLLVVGLLFCRRFDC